jgi:site-specific recombinase XerD
MVFSELAIKPEKEKTMLEEFFERLAADKRSRGNPLVVHLSPFAASLKEDGYAAATMQSKLWLLADFGQWLGRSGLAVRDLDERLVEAFFADKQRRSRVHRGDRETVRQFLGHLRERNVVPGLKPTRDESPLAGILNRYEKHLRSERGLAAATIINYLPFARMFLVDRFEDGPFVVRQVRSSDISAFVLRHAKTMSCRRAQLMTTAFRSFFRFLFQNGELQADLAPSVPAVADWRLSTVPKYLIPDDVDRVLSSCDRQTSTGRRDYAILVLLARLGLRAGEIVALQLEDIDWRAGEILVRGKGLLHDRMPLPVDVGEALTSYLRVDRPPCKTRRVFICMKAPRSGFAGPSTVTTIVRRALDRAGLHPPFKGAHVLRHSLATTMLRSGASMGEIGEVLRHRLPGTTEIYAKLDFDGLRSLAHPWPKVGGER